MAIDTTAPDRHYGNIFGTSSRGNLHIMVAEFERDVIVRITGPLVVVGVLALASPLGLRASSEVGLATAVTLAPAAFLLTLICNILVDSSMCRTKTDRLLLEQRFLEIFDKVESELRDVVAVSIGGVSAGMTLRDVVRYTIESELWTEGDLHNWTDALRVRQEMLKSVHCVPSLTSLEVSSSRLCRLYSNLHNAKKSIVESGPALSLIDNQMAFRAAGCVS